jgi:phosphopantetheinyl transferase
MTDHVEPIRWYLNTSRWLCTPPQLHYLLSLLPEEQADICRKFKHTADVKRAVCSRLMQRSCISTVTSARWDSIETQLTKGRKPYYAGPYSNEAWPNFNYSVSHEGDFVVLAAEPHCIVGVDLAAPLKLRAPPGRPVPPISSVLTSFQPQFAPPEVRYSLHTSSASAPARLHHQQHAGKTADSNTPLSLQALQGSSSSPVAALNSSHAPRQLLPLHLDALRSQHCPRRLPQWQQLQALAAQPPLQEAVFQQLWSLKESLVKAMGLGLAFAPLSRAAFSIQQGQAGSAAAATLCLDGAPAAE